MRIIEVGPRDGLQNEKTPIPTEAKLRFINALADAGLREIEVTSFVSPKWVPQLADAAELLASTPRQVLASALVPNAKGLERAFETGVSRIALFTASSEAFVQKNINMTIAESLAGFREIVASFREKYSGGWVRGYVSTAFECPFQGRIAPDQTAKVAVKLLEMGCDEVSLGDTIGVATPSEVRALHHALDRIDARRIAWHFHDTRGTAIANVAAALELGYTAFDSSSAGLGGCPYAPGAGGNLATEDLVYFLHREGFKIAVDLAKLATASLEILEILERAPISKAQQAELSRLRRLECP